MHFQQWYERSRRELTGQGAWLRGGEINTLPQSEWDARDYRVLFTRLSSYFDTGYSFTHQILYQIASGTEGVFPDLAYLPPPMDAPVFDRERTPWWIGTQTKRAPTDFDLIGISNSIVQELINLPTLLEKSGIALSKAERMADPQLPLILLGGANALYAGAIWESDPMVDLLFVGESDDAIRKILSIARDAKRAGKTKLETIKLLEAVPGVLQPDAPRKTRKAFIWSLNKSEALEKGPIYFIEDQLGKGHLQISEGCPCFCSFCAESWDRKPYRERSGAKLKETALRMKAAMGLESIEIYSFNFNMHSELYSVLWDLVPLFRRIGLKSQRFDLLAHDPEMVEFQHAIEKASITCGLEGISPRLRKYLHKNLENEQLHRSLEAIFKSNARELKVFLIATGLEQAEDFEALSDLLSHMNAIRARSGRGTRVVVSMTPLVRFPWTPLEFEEAFSIDRYKHIVKQTAHAVRDQGFEFRESADLPEYWTSQVLVRASDPRVAKALKLAVQRTGFVYYRAVNAGFREALEAALVEQGFAPKSLLAGHTLEESVGKPWTWVETGVKRAFLWEECVRARAYTEIDYCLGRTWAKAKCFLCGSCPSKEHILDIVHSKQTRAYTLAQFKQRLAEARTTECTAKVVLDVGPRGVGVPRSMVAVAVARALMLEDAVLTETYRGARAAGSGPLEEVNWLGGLEELTLAFRLEGMEALRAVLEDPQRLSRVNTELGDWAKVSTAVQTAPWHPRVIELSGPFRFRPEAYLKTRGIKYTLRKTTAGEQIYELTPQSVKKGVLRGVHMDGPRSTLRLEAGPKFEFAPFLAGAVSEFDPLRTLAKVLE